MTRIIICLAILTLFSCETNTEDSGSHSSLSDSSTNQENESPFSFEVTSSEVGYGYVIFKSGKAFIKQPYIPAIQGTKGFESKDDAAKVAELMIYKLEKDILPPSVSLDELDSLNISSM